MQVVRVVAATVIASLLALATSPGQGAGAKQLDAEDFARRPKLDRITFSPDARKFAALEEFKGRMNIVVADLDKGEFRNVTSFEGSDVGDFSWVSDKRLIFSLTDFQAGLSDQRGGGLIAVDADGKEGRRLAPTIRECENTNRRCRYTSFFQRIPGSNDEIIAVSNERTMESPDLVRLDTRSGKRSLITLDNPGHVRIWVLDKDHVPRAAMSSQPRLLQRTFWFKADAASSWRKVATFKGSEPGFEPLAFGPDGTLYVSSNMATKDKSAIYKFDPATGLPGEKLAAHPQVDIGIAGEASGARGGAPLIFDEETGALIGLRVDGDRPETVWFEEKRARLQKMIDVTLPKGNVNTLRLVSQTKAMVFSRSGSDPGAYYLYDEEKKQLQELARPRPWIKPEQMGEVRTIRYSARDGLEIPAYLTLPPGKEAKALPLVVWVHGGPWTRDEYRWDPDAQFFASRGYAVLQPNYRGSTGFGLRHLSAGFKQLGQTMQDDVTDGILKLVADGVVDRDRICIGGASYGGYAAMMGLVREPGLFKCGIDVVGVTDLTWWIELGYTDFNTTDSEAAAAWLTRTIGDPAKDGPMMDAHSPRLQAAKIRAPVLIVHGGGDQRVPIKHAEAMRSALRAAGNEPEWVVFPEEGHGFMKEVNRVEYYRRMESFLAKYLGR